MRLILYSGGNDPKDWATLRIKHLKDEVVQITREKAKRYAKSSTKTLLNEDVLDIIDRLRKPNGEQNDYVFDIFQQRLSWHFERSASISGNSIPTYYHPGM
ncbi:MAG TPA: hypothetical protein VK658_03420 [Chryseolinea sp.]|nr:hypothetical protein [Chryseolinea sp.]